MRLWFRDRLKFKIYSDELMSGITEAVKISMVFDTRFATLESRKEIAKALEKLAEDIRKDE